MTIRFNYEGKDYVLGFNRATVAEMERKGFSVADAEKQPIGTTMALWRGAFLLNHRDASSEVIDAIFESLDNKTALAEQLTEMYVDTLTSLFESPKNGIKWTAA